MTNVQLLGGHIGKLENLILAAAEGDEVVHPDNTIPLEIRPEEWLNPRLLPDLQSEQVRLVADYRAAHAEEVETREEGRLAEDCNAHGDMCRSLAESFRTQREQMNQSLPRPRPNTTTAMQSTQSLNALMKAMTSGEGLIDATTQLQVRQAQQQALAQLQMQNQSALNKTVPPSSSQASSSANNNNGTGNASSNASAAQAGSQMGSQISNSISGHTSASGAASSTSMQSNQHNQLQHPQMNLQVQTQAMQNNQSQISAQHQQRAAQAGTANQQAQQMQLNQQQRNAQQQQQASLQAHLQQHHQQQAQQQQHQVAAAHQALHIQAQQQQQQTTQMGPQRTQLAQQVEFQQRNAQTATQQQQQAQQQQLRAQQIAQQQIQQQQNAIKARGGAPAQAQSMPGTKLVASAAKVGGGARLQQQMQSIGDTSSSQLHSVAAPQPGTHPYAQHLQQQAVAASAASSGAHMPSQSHAQATDYMPRRNVEFGPMPTAAPSQRPQQNFAMQNAPQQPMHQQPLAQYSAPPPHGGMYRAQPQAKR